MRLKALLTGLVIILTPFAQARPLNTSAWLVDLGRDYPRTPQAGLTDADAEITLLLMQAASRVDPANAEAFRWQYDMLVALKRDEIALRTLGEYVEREPNDLATHLQWLALRIDQLQTAEQRADFCRTQLRQPNLNIVVSSDLHRRLAEFHRSRGEIDKAITEARAAVQASDLNYAARQILSDLTEQHQPKSVQQATQLANDLTLMASSPDDATLAWHIADQLVMLRLNEPADKMYDHAISLLQLADPWGNLPMVMTARAQNLRALDRTTDADSLVKKAGDAWQSLLAHNQGTLDPERMAEMAWFYVHFEPRPPEAEKLARMAVVQVPDLVVGHRALGGALRLLGRFEEAKRELQKVADRDPAATCEYAQLLATMGDKDSARQTLLAASTRPVDPAGEAILQQTAKTVGITVPAPVLASAEARQAVAKFPWAVLDYPLHPDKYMSLVLDVPQRQMPPGEPWVLTARLRNIGSFPITLGPDMMVEPELLIEVNTTGDRPRTTGPTIHMSFNKTAVLAVGQSVEVSGNINLGAVRAGMIGTPQMIQDVTVNAVLSPLSYLDAQGQEIWTAGIGGLKAETLRFRRNAFIPDAPNMADLQRRLQSTDTMERIAAMELLTMLLAESQHIRAGRLHYRAMPIDTTTVQKLILSRTDDADWQVRARLSECLRWFVLDKEATNTASRMLSDPHWLVRGLTMRALADQYGPKFLPVLAKAGKIDPDEWVRQFTTALNTRVATAASQPASQPVE